MQTVDKFQRPLRDLRISVTDRCNFRCAYCMPAEIFGERYEFLPREELLTFEEIYRVANISAQLGVKKIRITGGEPLVRQNVPELIKMLSSIKEIEDIAMTTNAYLLKKFAKELKQSGLNRITVSLDSIDDEIFQKMNGRGFKTKKIIDGIKEAQKVGFNDIKINSVVQKNVNDKNLLNLVEWCREENLIPRFIEYMDVGTLNNWKLDEVVSASEIIEIISSKYPVSPIDPSYRGEVAKRYGYKDGKGEFGIISSVTQPFCGDCTRMRLSPEGQMVTCLFASSGIELRESLRKKMSDEEIKQIIKNTWNVRKDRYSEERNPSLSSRPKVEMYHIGG
jgi:cyclic pyranopterin phosphate synthase